jgi:hypothetical protein
MKAFVASTLFCLGLLASSASAAPSDTNYSNYPQWAQKAFSGSGH